MQKNRNYSALLPLIVVLGDLLGYVVPHSEEITLLLVSFDGFRHDYLDMAKRAGKKTPNFDTLITDGVLAHHMKNAFITKTFPNHWTIATGMYEESHGVVANEMYDPVFNETFNNTPEQGRDPKWWNNGSTGAGGEPIWHTNEKHHGRSGVYFWPGSTDTEFIPSLGRSPPYDRTVPNKTRIDHIVEWFSTEDNPINLGLLYFEQPDSLGHEVGPDSPRMPEMIEELDGLVGYLIQKLKEKKLFDKMNIIITSDHGMSQIKDVIYLDDYVDPSLYTHFGSSPIWAILPKPGKENEVYAGLQNVTNATVFWKENIPEEFKYKYNRRIQPILLMADDHFGLCHDNESCYKGGNHGYSNKLDDMHPIFIAHGPAFKKNYTVTGQFNNVDLYPLMCEILHIEPARTDGVLTNIEQILKESSYNVTLIIGLISIGFCSAVAGLICVGSCRTTRIINQKKRRLAYALPLDNGIVESREHLLTSEEEEIS